MEEPILNIIEYCDRDFPDLIQNPTLGFEQEFPALNFDPKRLNGRNYEKIKEILQSVKEHFVSEQELPVVQNNKLYKVFMHSQHGGLTQQDFLTVKKYCWGNYSNFYPGEKAVVYKLWIETLPAHLIDNIFSFIDYYPMGLDEKSSILTNTPHEMLYMLSDNEISNTAKLFLKQHYYNCCFVEKKLEYMHYVCELNIENVDFEKFSTSTESILNSIPLIANSVPDSPKLVDSLALSSTVDPSCAYKLINLWGHVRILIYTKNLFFCYNFNNFFTRVNLKKD